MSPHTFALDLAKILEIRGFNGAIHNPRHVKPQTNQTLDTSNLKHIKPKTHKTSDKEYRAVNYITDKNAFFVIRLCFVCFLSLFVISCFKKFKVLVGHITLTL